MTQISDQEAAVWLQLEQSVLGAVMLDASVLAKCELHPGDFHNVRHREIWRVMQQQSASNRPCDALSLAERLDAVGKLEDSGGLPYLATLCRETASSAAGPHYAQRIRSLSILRQARAMGDRLSKIDDTDQLDSHIRDLIELTKGAQDFTCDLHTAMTDAIGLMDGSMPSLSTGLKDLDAMIGGLHDEDLIVVGARPAMGKTAFMLNLALSAKGAVGIISGEQGRAQIGMRCIAIGHHVSLHGMRMATLSDLEWSRVTDAIQAARDKQIWLYDKPAPTIDEVVRQARSWKYERGIKVLMVDYLQKLRGGEGEAFRLQLGDVIARLKDLGRELRIPIVVLAQVKREVEARPMHDDGLGRMPFAADMAESSVIEQEADQIMTLYRPEVYASDDPRFRGMAYVNVCKNRHGPIGHSQVVWRGEFLQFADLAHHETAYQDRWTSHGSQSPAA